MTSPHAAQPPKAKKQKREKPVLEALPDNGHPGHSKFARSLASVDYQTREKGLHALKGWLLRKNDLQESDMMKIWKGLFYCFWHSDKAPVQAELAERLAAMLTQLPEQSAYLYFTAFMATMRREWFGIDRLRMDKFLMLIRKFIHHTLACLKAAKWRADLVQRYADYLHRHVVLPADTLLAAGVAFHCGDVLLDELRGVAEGRPLPGSALAALLEPFVAALQSGEQVALHRIGEGLFDTLMSELGDPTEDSPYLRQLDVAALAAQLFERGAAPATRARNRQVLYDLSGAMERLQRKRQRVDDGAQAGPSTSKEAAPAKATKKQLKEKKAAAAAAAAVAAASAADAELTAVADGDAAAADANGNGSQAARLKRKAKAFGSAPAPDAGQQRAGAAREPAAAVAADGADQKPDGVKKKLGKKKRTLQEALMNGDAANAVESDAAAEPSPSVAKAAAAAGRGVSTGAPLQREPSSGQKAALRAAVAKLASAPDAAAETAATTPKRAKGKKAASDAVAAQQEGLKADAAAASPASSPAPATDGKVSALGKRAAPGSAVKAGPATAQKQPHQQQVVNGAAVAKTPVQASDGGKNEARARAVTTVKKGRVVINLKKNLYFEHGGPVPAPDVRTPPPARAKGGILKKPAQSCPPKVAPSAAAAAMSAKQQQKGQAASDKQQSARVLPKQARRASAALFF